MTRIAASDTICTDRGRRIFYDYNNDSRRVGKANRLSSIYPKAVIFYGGKMDKLGRFVRGEMCGLKHWRWIDLDEKRLIELYVKNKKSPIEIAKMFNVGATTITRRLRKHGVLRNIKEATKNALATGRRKRLFNGHGPNWKGGSKKTWSGYVQVYKPNYSGSYKNMYILEHRYVMEKHLGRHLKAWELIHHKNGIKDDNRLKNLEIVVRKKHYGKLSCPFCNKTFLIK